MFVNCDRHRCTRLCVCVIENFILCVCVCVCILRAPFESGSHANVTNNHLNSWPGAGSFTLLFLSQPTDCEPKDVKVF